jgi:GT2 family glycosyltransferase
VHGDYEATRLCLETLLADDEGEIPRKIIVVDDHAPDRRIAGMLRDLAGTNAISLICNERNLGFARTINRGLQMLADEDALLLNADTVVPPGFLDRLARAAYAEPNIGTVTPLSNNGEYTSLPVPFRVNALPAVEGIAAIDRAAARVNAGRVIDLPNGVGFCLYLTRACLDRLGFLSEGFGRGYAEDIDFCLRAADAGFRNVCAADVFVGHAGSRSFAGDKRALVMRNLATLERRFPGYRAASAAFLAADPLRPARETIERALIGDLNPVHLLFGGETTERHVVQERSQSLLRRHGQVWTGVAGLAAGRVRLAIRDARGGIPQNLRFDCALDQAETELRKVLRALPIKRIEFADLAATPSALVKAARRAKIPYDVMVRDAGFVCGWRPGNSGNGRNRPCRGIRSGPTEGTIFGKNARAEPSRSPRDFLRDALTGADKLLAADRHLANSLKPIAGIRRVVVEKFDDENVAFADEGPPPPPPAKCLGVVSSGKNLGTSLQLRELLHKLDDDKWSLVLLGPAFADLSLMAETSAFVTGAVEPEELPSLARGIGISHLLLSERSAASVFHRHARRCRLPIARFDWRQPKTRRRGGDLVLSPAARTGEIARAVRKWLTAAEIRHAKN